MLTVDDLLRITSTLRGVIMILGEPDTGKSYFAKQLFMNAKLHGIDVSLLDLDVGQQSLAYPGTIAFTRGRNQSSLGFEKMSFIGSINPIYRIDELIHAARYFLTVCLNSDLIIVDTSGLVSGPHGRDLKIKKIKSLTPDLIIGIQRKDELEHIFVELTNFRIMRILPSHATLIKTREQRIKNRNERLLSYFSQTCGYFSLGLRKLNLKPEGRVHNIPQGRIIGLNCGIETIALGILEWVDSERIFFRSPLNPEMMRDIDTVVFGERGLEVPI
ncbi:MAG: Clp1/GlmU family protein [Deltaproteobacteria bacterium]|nr:Clp1/GlmU family protein [Deltaproteobacteria bacterium]